MNIKINGQIHQTEDLNNISAVLRFFKIEQTSGIAVALNDTVVPKQEFEKRAVHDGDEIEIIRAVQGG
jgi:sulfur carrier protein